MSVTSAAATHKHPSLNLRPADSVSHPASYHVMSCLFRAAPLFPISSLTLANTSSNIKEWHAGSEGALWLAAGIQHTFGRD